METSLVLLDTGGPGLGILPIGSSSESSPLPPVPVPDTCDFTAGLGLGFIGVALRVLLDTMPPPERFELYVCTPFWLPD